VALRAGIADRVISLFAAPLGDYQASFISNPALSRTLAGLAGLAVIYVLCVAISRALASGKREGV
jgi:hypothetical protein